MKKIIPRPEYLTPEEFKVAKQKFHAQRSNSRKRVDKNGNQILFKLTFEEWSDIWWQSGQWHNRGLGAGQYCMSRKNDLGHYEPGNVEIILSKDNIVEGNVGVSKNRGRRFNVGIKRSEETKKKMSECRKRQTLTPKNTPLQTPKGVFPTVKAAAEHYGITTEAIHYFKRKYPTEYYYVI